MRPTSLPAVPYDATAVRPGFSELPAALRDAISLRLGAPVVAARTAGAGFTSGFAAVLETASGDRAFVKAAPLTVALSAWYAREAAVTAALPDPVPAARPRWTMAAADHFVLCLDAVDGRVPALPWTAADLDAALAAWALAAAALREPAPGLLAIGLPRLPDLLRSDLSCWSGVAAGAEPMPPAPDWVTARLGELVTLERALPGHAAGTGVTHGDLRLDNILIDVAGAGRICDWTWPCLGAPWFDTVTLLVTAYAGGCDADALLAAHPTAAGAPAEGIDGALAALSGYWLTRSVAGPGDGSPHARAHQRFSGTQSLAWLADRRGWA
jgi:aminoglycoside phosphotransferase (APT) family kinase protein